MTDNSSKMKFEIRFEKGKSYRISGTHHTVSTDVVILTWLGHDGKKITTWNWKGKTCWQRCTKKLEQIKAVCEDFIVVHEEVSA